MIYKTLVNRKLRIGQHELHDLQNTCKQKTKKRLANTNTMIYKTLVNRKLKIGQHEPHDLQNTCKQKTKDWPTGTPWSTKHL